MIFKDYYKILALETNKVSIEEIKTAYREQAKKYHPDVNVGNKNAEERFKDINEAYNTLSNQVTRKKYDRMWNSHIGRKKAKDNNIKQTRISVADTMFNMFFGDKKIKPEDNKYENKNKKVPIQGENVETEIEISIEDAFFGRTKEISLRTISGKMKTFDIKIPEGIRNSEKIRLIGQGKTGLNGGKNGDLLIQIKIVNNNEYTLVGDDICKNIYISPWEAILGAKVEVKTIDETLFVYVPKCIQTDESIRIHQKGYKNGKGGRGDLILQFKIMIQKNPTEEEKELYKKLKQISKFNPRQFYD